MNDSGLSDDVLFANYAATQINAAWDDLFSRNMTRPERMMVALQLASDMRRKGEGDYGSVVTMTLAREFCLPMDVPPWGPGSTQGSMAEPELDWLDRLLTVWDRTESEDVPRGSLRKDLMLARVLEAFGMEDREDVKIESPEAMIQRRRAALTRLLKTGFDVQRGVVPDTFRPSASRVAALRQQRRRIRNRPSALRFRELLICESVQRAEKARAASEEGET